MAYVDDWEKLLLVGRTMGLPNAKVRVIEFSDLQCPYCARFHSTVQQLLESRPELSYTFVHYPGSRHPDARRMALGAECAAEEGKFFRFVKIAFALQDSLGTITIANVARRAGISSLAAFADCLDRPESGQRVDEGLRWGRELGVTGTPTVLVNGYRLPPVQRDSLLLATVNALSAGTDPWATPWWKRPPSWWKSESSPARTSAHAPEGSR